MQLDERGKACPLPVIETKKALERSVPGTVIEVMVDNEIAVQNLLKMAEHKGLAHQEEKLAEQKFCVRITAAADHGRIAAEEEEEEEAEPEQVSAGIRQGLVAAIGASVMGQGDDVLGKVLMKSFIYALSQQDTLPQTVLLFNGGAFLSCEGSESVQDLQAMAAEGVEILTCGTCLNHYGLTEKLAVGSVTNMYDIVERMTRAKSVVRP